MRRRSTLTRPSRIQRSIDNPFGHRVNRRGKTLVFDKETKDWYMYFDGRFIGARRWKDEAERELDHYAYEVAVHIGYIKGYRDGMKSAGAST